MTINMKKNMNKREYFFLAAVCNNKVVDLEVTESSLRLPPSSASIGMSAR